MSARGQAEEGLRRATTPSPTCQALMLRLANHLRATFPTEMLFADTWTNLSRAVAVTLVGAEPADVEPLLAELRAHQPVLRAGISRGEYALRLDKAAGGSR